MAGDGDASLKHPYGGIVVNDGISPAGQLVECRIVWGQTVGNVIACGRANYRLQSMSASDVFAQLARLFSKVVDDIAEVVVVACVPDAN